MALQSKKQVACPEGVQLGTIKACRETTKTFDRSKGPEAVVEVVIQPDYHVPGAETLDVSVIFSPILNGLSALDGFLTRIGKAVPDGETWHPASIERTRVQFEAKRQPNGFTKVVKETIIAAPAKA